MNFLELKVTVALKMIKIHVQTNLRCSWKHILRYSTHDTYFFWGLIILSGYWRILDLFYTKNLAFDNHGLDRSQNGTWQFSRYAFSPNNSKNISCPKLDKLVTFSHIINISGLLYWQSVLVMTYSCKAIPYRNIYFPQCKEINLDQ